MFENIIVNQNCTFFAYLYYILLLVYPVIYHNLASNFLLILPLTNLTDPHKEGRLRVKPNGGHNDTDFNVYDVYLSRVHHKDHVRNARMIDDL